MSASPLQICGACAEAFVEPVSVLASLGEDVRLLELECRSCGHLALAACGERAHEELDRALDAAEAQLRAVLAAERA